MLKLALVGYGKMGRLIEHLAPSYDCEVALRLDEFNNAEGSGITPETFSGIDVAVDFSVPDAAVSNIERISALGVNLVVGTTGWREQMDHVRQSVEAAGTGLVWSANYSIGVRMFAEIVARASELLESEANYESWCHEIHHSAKKDAPSGTALWLVEEMRKAGYSRRVDMASNRAGAIPGTHEIGFDSTADTITLRHTARNREGFARGALKAAQWIAGKKGFFEFGEMLFG